MSFFYDAFYGMVQPKTKKLCAPTLMNSADMATIAEFAKGNEEMREKAIEVYNRNRWIIGNRGNDHMLFMSEIMSDKPDFSLLTFSRQAVITEIPSN